MLGPDPLKHSLLLQHSDPLQWRKWLIFSNSVTYDSFLSPQKSDAFCLDLSKLQSIKRWY